ncbi:MAG TPA: plastocyanin/azurin family copper-binding protein [Solirubrobacteraceae bacterium]|nr:plastocyanin/azurin family copper-binding protein [Solirubrobacteraceae bacterium]
MRLRDVIAVLAGGGALALASGCSLSEDDPDLVAGKKLFVERCGSCHALARAETKGTQGPNLDEAFQHALASGMERSGIQGAVHEQILHPANLAEDNKVYMPPGLVTGKDALNVAAYVAEVVARPGKDTGLLATAVPKAGGGEPAVAEDGVLTIDSTAQLAYETNAAEAPPGPTTIRSPNPSTTPHNIAVTGPGGVNEVGEVVTDGGVSEVKATLRRGEYDFFCTVEGHREAGMAGKLVVK